MTAVNHIGIIMDGNGRWAQRKGRPRTYGHIKGARTAKKIITAASHLGVKHLTLYAFSTENWLRPEPEVFFLMNLLRRYIAKEAKNLVKENVRFSVIGELHRLPEDLKLEINNTIDQTKACTGLNLVFAISYGSRNEIVDATKKIVARACAGDLSLNQIDENLFAHSLHSYPMPDVDLIIRTSGERRLSNFLLWQAAYSELSFSETLWPDFTKEELEKIITSFNLRERRFGNITAIKTDHEDLSY